MNAAARALRALEKTVRLKIATSMDTLTASLTALIINAVSASGLTSATELLSQPTLWNAMKALLDAARAAVWTTILATYAAANAIGRALAALLLRPLGHTVPIDLTVTADTETRLRRDVDDMFGSTILRLADGLRAAYDGVGGDDPAAARILTSRRATVNEINRLRNRAVASGVTAVHRGSRDAELAAFANYRQVNPYIVMRKRWTVMATDPCPMCAALNGTTIALDAEFDHTATLDPDHPALPVWGDLQGPPRHPNCRCQITLVTDGN